MRVKIVEVVSCAVLDNGIRVLTATAVFQALSKSRKGKSSETYRADRMPSFINANNPQPFVDEQVKGWTELMTYIDLNGKEKTGYDARILRGAVKYPLPQKGFMQLRQSRTVRLSLLK